METTLTFKAPAAIAQKLGALAQRLERPKSYIIRKALEQYLEEDEDYQIAMQRMEEDKLSKRIPFEQIKRKYGLED